ncbi:M16 family metallopeptidase [Endozoicomonadaceae bacterium StTr2]
MPACQGSSRLSMLSVLVFLIISTIWMLHLEKQPRQDKRLPSGISRQDIESEQAQLSNEPPVHVVEPVYWQTDSGVKVYFVSAPELPMVDINLLFNAGSARDGEEHGLANLTVKMLVQGVSGMNASAISRQFERLGAQYSCAIQRDSAVVSLRSLSSPDALQPAIELLKQVMAKPAFTQLAFNRVKNQVLAELRYKKQWPAIQAEKALWKIIYSRHPYAHNPMGTESSVMGLRRHELVRFHQQYYVASNLVIAITGDIDLEQAKNLAETVSELLPKGEVPEPLPDPVPMTAPHYHAVRMATEQTHICLGWLGVSRTSPDYPALVVGSYILGGGLRSSRLYRILREERGLTYAITSEVVPLKKNGPLIIKLQTQTDHAREALAVVKQVLNRFVEEGITTEELEAARHYLRGSYPLSLDCNEAMVARLCQVGLFDLPLDELARFMEDVQKLTVGQVQETVRRYMNLQTMSQIRVGRDVISAAEE